MKTKGVRKFLRCLTPKGILVDDEKCKCKRKKIDDDDDDDDDDIGHEDIFVSSNNSFNGTPKGYHKKLPHFLKGMFRTSSLVNKLARNKSKVKPSSGTTSNASSALTSPRLERNSSDTSSSIFTSSSRASSSLASSCSYCFVPSKLRSSSEMKKTCPVDSKPTTIESPSSISINNNMYKQALMEKANVCYFGSNYAIYFLILGLMALLTWAKIFAVFCTSVCLLFAHPRQLKVIQNNSQLLLDDNNVLNVLELSEKHVVMEGF